MRFSLLRDANTAVAREHVVDVLMLPPPLRVKVVVVVVVSSKPSFFFGKDELSEKNKNRTAVSYTHLTLPTICSV